MNFTVISQKYLTNLRLGYEASKRTGEYTPELSYRPVLNDYFKDLIELMNLNVDLVYEPKNQGTWGRPDWRFSDKINKGVYGYIEAKKLDFGKRIIYNNHIEQVDKYKTLNHTIILTDGLEFIFFKPDELEPISFSLVDKPFDITQNITLNFNSNLEISWRAFFNAPTSRTCSETKLIEEVAKRAHQLALNIDELSQLTPEEGVDEQEKNTIETLLRLKKLLENHHDPEIKNSTKIFANFVSQVLIFGLLYAHRVTQIDDDTSEDKYNKISKFWLNTIDEDNEDNNKELKPFRALIQQLNNDLKENNLGKIGVWYEDCILLLSYIRLSITQKENPDYHTLYEKFLSFFDPQQRFDYGVFYTPSELAYFSIGLAQAIISLKFGSELMYSDESKIIDPCCGTGTFLEQLVKYSNEEEIKADIVGLEILPAPYALAHYRMLAFKDSAKKLSIILTNTLSDDLASEVIQSPQNLLEEEQNTARKLTQPPLLLVIGNPPSKESSSNQDSHTTGENFTHIRSLLEKFRPPTELRTPRQNNQKQIDNDFMLFLAWSCDKIIQSTKGIFSLILPSSFAENESYLFARKWLIENFSNLWVVDLDMDGRTGVNSQSLFKTLQGRILVIGVHNNSHNSNEKVINYCSITGISRQEKVHYLAKKRNKQKYLDLFQKVLIGEQTYDFRPSPQYDEEMWSKFWPLYPSLTQDQNRICVFNRHVSGIKLAPSSLFVHVNKNLLKRRSKFIGNKSNNLEQINNNWYSGQQKPPNNNKITELVRDEFTTVDLTHIQNYSYRPFLTTQIINLDSLFNAVQQSTGQSSGTRLRPELLSAYKKVETIGIAITPGPKDIGNELHRFTSFCWYLPDNDLCKRGNAHILCNQFPEYKTNARNQSWNSNPQNNISEHLTNILRAHYNDSDNVLINSDNIVYYVYAILCSNTFLEKFEGALFTVSGPKKIPRIPFPLDKNIFSSIVRTGKELALLEKEEEISVPEKYNTLKSLFTSEFNLMKTIEKEELKINDEFKVTITLKDTSDEAKVIVSDLDSKIINYKISGYCVVDQWLKMYSYNYKRAAFTQQDYNKFIDLLYCIEQQLVIISRLDTEVKQLFSKEDSLINIQSHIDTE